VLKSWAVPDGPSYWPGNRRQAVQVEDHRREYAFFEGVIPEGYGAGIVMLWDWGTWEPLPSCTDVDASLRGGLLKFIVHGEKLKGVWVLTRVKHSAGNRRKPVWMLAKEQDSFARSETAKSILEEAPNSISTRRTLEEIAESWNRGKSKNELQGELFGE
jgi:bifunctional non-homologous end joining protein LigD